MKVLVLSQMYPDKSNPHFGVFIKREVESIASRCDLEVVVPRPWFSKKSKEKQKPQAAPDVEKTDAKSRVNVHFKRYFPLPGSFFMPIKGYWFFLFTFGLIRRIKEKFDFEIIHAHRVYPEGFCAAVLKKIFKKPVVISIRGADINELPRRLLMRKMVSYALRNADAVVTVSRSLKDRALALGINANKVSVMPKGVDMGLFKPMDRDDIRKKLNLPIGKTIILSVGWIIHRKNPFAFLKTALSVPAEKRNKYLFVMVGEGPLRQELEENICREGLESMFHFAGSVEPVEIPLWMNAADIFTLVSFSEGMPNVLYESMACGCPVIASNVDGAAEIIEHEKNGLLVSPHDYQEISSKILMLAENKSLRRLLGKNSRAYMEYRQLEWHHNANWLLNTYSRIL